MATGYFQSRPSPSPQAGQSIMELLRMLGIGDNPQFPALTPAYLQGPMNGPAIGYPPSTIPKMQDQVPQSAMPPVAPGRNLGLEQSRMWNPRAYPEDGVDPGLTTPDNIGTNANLGDGVRPQALQQEGTMPPPAPDAMLGPSYPPSQGPGDPVIAATKDPLDGFLKALAAIQPPAEPEQVRVATPPPPAKPQNDVGNLLRILLASNMGSQGIPGLGQTVGR